MDTQWVPWVISAALLVLNVIQYWNAQKEKLPALRFLASGQVRAGNRMDPPVTHRAYWYLENTGNGTAYNVHISVPGYKNTDRLHVPRLDRDQLAWLKGWSDSRTYFDYMADTADGQPAIAHVSFQDHRHRKHNLKIALPGPAYDNIKYVDELDRVVGERPPLKEC